MPGLHKVFIDITARRPVVSETNPDRFIWPPLVQENGVDVEWIFVRPTGSLAPPIYERLTLAGYSLYVSVGIRSTNTVHASQNVFSISADNTSLSGIVDLNTAGMNALADGADVDLEVRLTPAAGSPISVQIPATFRKAVALSTAVVTPATDNGLGRLEAARVYVKKEGAAGEGIVLTSASGLKKAILYCDDDGSARFEPLA